jgi:hypothetical protein
MDILTRLWLVDMLPLEDQYQRLLCASDRLRAIQSLRIAGEWVIVVVPVALVWCSSLWMAPNSILQHLIPNKPATGSGCRWIATNLRRVFCIRIRY